MTFQSLPSLLPAACASKQISPEEEDREEREIASLFRLACAPFPVTFNGVTKRYFTHYLIRDCKKITNNNCRLLQHSNSLIVLSLDPSHAAVIAGPNQLDRIEFGSSRKSNGRSDVEHQSTTHKKAFSPINVIGKRKKNALVCHKDMRLCTIYMKNGDVFPIPACVNGFVLEFNAILFEHPELVLHCPLSEGFLCIIDTNTSNNFSMMEKVWSATGGEAMIEEEDE